MRSNTQLLAQVTEFIGYEADLLDHKGYQEWLSLWTEEGLYIVPADLKATDYLNTLNLALDDADMRRMRVARLENGESVSALSVGDTVRMMSRVRILEAGDEVVIARCAMTLNELRHGKLVSYPANVEYILRRVGDGFRMEQKVVKLLHADGFLRTVSFIF
ncbi:3-phenylpropionate/cinnamic acid dioxygenase, small subunit [Pseudomonas linyingensis]|uniref:3-phenylpropionate/cinnamic acid dioxygenase, small subunit n=1 Tax=Pseudomonas linyingensis TaxID=915471 RepID=A0A1H6WP72_9PSED|nr:aromatic-ring-hydroxylating dioxygenase subunit beta [Pseudomonas linyingensis]SEJ18821.1 3-phenylpropionate/cinnamic acid dioxygenase, small subunit [Pseudomonas linyingensis]